MSNRHILMIFVTRLKFAVERLAEDKSVKFQQDESGYILFNYVLDFKFILWINCEAELIREEKQKNAAERGVWDCLHVSCRMRLNASPGLVELKITRLLSPRYTQPNGAVKYRFFRRRMAAVEQK